MARKSKYPPGEPCECHGVPKLWNKDERRPAGGRWCCAVKSRDAKDAWDRANPEKRRAWRERDPEKRKEVRRAWREANPDYFKNWRKANPEKVLANDRSRVCLPDGSRRRFGDAAGFARELIAQHKESSR